MRNYLPRTWSDARVYSGPSAIDGKGLFTSAPIKAGERVMEWGGTVITRRAYETDWANWRGQTVVQIDEDHLLGLPITDEDESIDEWLNHSCDPNLWMIDEVTLVARRDIAAGEELTLDSATWNDDEEEDYSDTGFCMCGAANCREKITPLDWKIPELQKRYKGHFSPYLQRRIDVLLMDETVRRLT